MLHGSHKWGEKGLGRIKMKHENGFGCFSWFPRVGWEGFRKVKMKHEKGVGCFMVHKSEVGRAWEGSKEFPSVAGMVWERQK